MIKLSSASLSGKEIQAVVDVLKDNFFGMGKKVQEFEEALSVFFNQDVVCVVNGTAALHLACQSIGLQKGDEVLVPSLTYVASFQAIKATGATPIPCDVEENTLTISIEDLKTKLSKNTKAIMPVHYAGSVGKLDEVYEFANKNNLRVIEDAAHAFGSSYKDKRVGSFGDIVCFSFDGIKNLTSGEGGCIVSSDPMVLSKARDARLLGVERDTENRFKNQRSWDFDVSSQGWRYHMSDIMAAIGIEQLKFFHENAKKRISLAKIYQDLLVNFELIKPVLNYDKDPYAVPHIYPVRIFGLNDRQGLRNKLLKNGIETGIHYKPNHLLSYFMEENLSNTLTITEEVYPELLTLPLHPLLEKEDLKKIITSLIREIPAYV